MDSSDDEITVKSKKRVIKIDSDESDDEVQQNISPIPENHDDISKDVSVTNTNAIDSDVEDPKESKSLKKRKALFADSSDEDDDKASTLNVSKSLLTKEDFEDSSDDDHIVSKNKSDPEDDPSPSNSESEGELNEAVEIAKIEEQAKKQKQKPVKRQDRKSKDAAMKEIYSESQRMFRESGLRVGYHRPKQRTLDEFLNRKKKHLISEVIDDIKIKKAPVNPDEFQKRLDECEKLTEEFYKNEEEEEDDDDEDFVKEKELGNDEKSVNEPKDLTEKSNDGDDNNGINDTVIQEFTKDDTPLEPILHKEISIDRGVNEGTNHSLKNSVDQASVISTPIEIDLIETKNSQESLCAEVNDSGIVPGNTATDESASNSDDDTQKLISEKPSIGNENLQKEESLRLFLEPDTEKYTDDDDDVVLNSQKTEVDQTISEKQGTLLSKKLEKLSKNFDGLEDRLSKKPSLAKPVDGDIIFNEDSDVKKDEPEELFVKRLMKHANASSALPPSKAGRKKHVDITVVRKEIDSKGNEKLKSETINYKVDLSEVSKAKKTEKPGAQLLALKKTLKDKILEKKKLDWEIKKQQDADDNEEGFVDDEEDDDEFEEGYDEEEEDSSEGESEPPSEDEDAYIKSDKKFKRVKSAFLDDEAIDEDEIAESNNPNLDQDDVTTPVKENEEETMHLTLEDDEEELQNDVDNEKTEGDFRTPSMNSQRGRTISKTNSETSFSDLISAESPPRWTPFDKRINEEPTNLKADDNVRRKLGFESLFDTSDPHVTEMEDVVGLCSGQFVTQKPIVQETQTQSQETQASHTVRNFIIPNRYYLRDAIRFVL